MKKTVGLVGWRGMVGSVLMQRMRDEGDFALIEPVFFSTSNAGGKGPAVEGLGDTTCADAFDVAAALIGEAFTVIFEESFAEAVAAAEWRAKIV